MYWALTGARSARGPYAFWRVGAGVVNDAAVRLLKVK